MIRNIILFTAGSLLIALAIITAPLAKATYSISDLGASIGAVATSSTSSPVLSSASTTTPNEQSAQASTSTQTEDESDITPSDLGVSDPVLLPNSHFYFLKNWWRNTRLLFTFNPVKKTELENKFANEKLIEAKKLTQKTKNPKILEKAIKNYEESIGRIENQAQKLKEKSKNNPELNKFLDKFTRQQILHGEILDRLEKKVPPKVLQHIKEAREKHLNVFRDVMTKLENKDQIPQRLEKAVEKIKRLHFPEVRALQILKRIEEKSPSTTTKEKIGEAEDRIIHRLQKRVEKANRHQRKIFEKIINRVGNNNRTKVLEIIGKLQNGKSSTSTRSFLNQVKRGVIKQIFQKEIQKIKKQFTPAKIKDILNHPEKWINKKVKVNGRIVVSQKLTVKGLPKSPLINYYIEDETGRIGVIGHLPHPIPITPLSKIQKCVPEGSSLGAVTPKNKLECCPGLISFIPHGLLGIKGYCINPNHYLIVLGEVKNKGLIKSKSTINNNFSPYIVAFHTQWNPPIRTIKKVKKIINNISSSSIPHVKPILHRYHQYIKNKKDEHGVCIQVVTPAQNPKTGQVKRFPTPCDVPEGWIVLPQKNSQPNINQPNSSSSQPQSQKKSIRKYENFLHRHLRMSNE